MSDLTGFHTQRLTWVPATEESLAGLQTATVDVPLNYADPDGRAIKIGLARHPASSGTSRGVLLIAPDDPGNRGMVLIPQLLSAVPAELADDFDLVAFDHRFSGASAPIECDFTPDERLWVFHSPETFESEIRFQSAIAAKVAEAALDVLPYASTRNIARDMDVIRAALGQEKISYLGYSYGTYLGAVYAQMFGPRVDRMVLDSVLSPDWVWRGLFFQVTGSVEASLTRWARWAAERDADFGLGATPQAVRAAYDDVAKRATAAPLAVGGLPMPVDLFTLHLFSVVFLTYDRTYPMLGDLLRSAVHGGGVSPDTVGTLMALLGMRSESTPGGQLAVLCGEWSWPRRLDVYERDMGTLGERYPLIGRTLGTVKAGAFWPTSPAEPLTSLGPDSRAESILLVQAENDIFTGNHGSTGTSGAARLRELLPHNTHLVTAADTACHRLFPFGENHEVNAITAEYLRTGGLPEHDITCGRAGVAR